VFVNPFEQPGRWYKANLHTHTTVSDGQATPEERVEQYRSEGYSALAITDHDVVSRCAGLSTSDFLVIDGVELSVHPFDDERFFHLVSLNVPAHVTPPSETDPNSLMRTLKSHGAETFVAHPYWSSNTLCDLQSLRGHVGVEVFNASCLNIGKACSSVHWDQLLERGLQVPALAVDDTHSGHDGMDLFGGWVMLKMPELSAQAVLDALRVGCYYSSAGPEVFEFRVVDGMARVRCEPAVEIHFMAATWHGQSFYAGDGPLLSRAEAPVREGWRYVRAEIVGADGRRAWTNPIYL